MNHSFLWTFKYSLYISPESCIEVPLSEGAGTYAYREWNRMHALAYDDDAAGEHYSADMATRAIRSDLLSTLSISTRSPSPALCLLYIFDHLGHFVRPLLPFAAFAIFVVLAISATCATSVTSVTSGTSVPSSTSSTSSTFPTSTFRPFSALNHLYRFLHLQLHLRHCHFFSYPSAENEMSRTLPIPDHWLQ